jgi:hypothetical protein
MDWDLWLKLLKVGEAQFIPHIMARLRAHSEAKSSNKKISDLKESYNVFRSHSGSYFSIQFLKYMFYFTRYVLTGKITKNK